MIKDFVKHAFGRMRAYIANIKHVSSDIYIGRNVNIKNGKNIKLGKSVSIRPGCDLFAGGVFEIGDGCDIGVRNRIAGRVIVEDAVLIGPDNFICSYDHSYEKISVPIISQSEYNVKKNGHEELKIGFGSWIGTHCAIIGDVHIGKHCVIGANSVVTRDVPDYCVAVGNPARVVKKYNFEISQWESIK